MRKLTLWAGVAAVFGLLVMTSTPASAQCACECIDSDGDSMADDEECCTPTDASDPEGTLTNLEAYGVCGCINVADAAATNGKIDEEGPSGCINVGDTDTNDLLGGGSCTADGLAACRAGQCTTVTVDSPNCS